MASLAAITDRAPTARAGRPRDTRLDDAIEAATVELLAERGYNGCSIKAVAERAGTTTPTIYRRWSSKADLVLGAVFRTEGDDVVADTGDVEADVRTMVRWTLEKLGRPAGRAALAGLLGEPIGAEPALRDRLVGVWRRVGDRLRQCVDAGELRGDLDVEAHIAALTGPALMTAVLHGEEAVTEDRVEALASIALDGIRSPRTGPAGSTDRHRP